MQFLKKGFGTSCQKTVPCCLHALLHLIVPPVAMVYRKAVRLHLFRPEACVSTIHFVSPIRFLHFMSSDHTLPLCPLAAGSYMHMTSNLASTCRQGTPEQCGSQCEAEHNGGQHEWFSRHGLLSLGNNGQLGVPFWIDEEEGGRARWRLALVVGLTLGTTGVRCVWTHSHLPLCRTSMKSCVSSAASDNVLS